MSRSRAYSFVVNPGHYPDRKLSEVDDWKDTISEYRVPDPKIRWLKFSLERGTNLEGLHLQGAVYFENAVTVSAAAKLMKGSYRPIRVSIAANSNYVSKNPIGEVYEYGEEPKPGKRNDIHAYRDAVIEGMTDNDLGVNFPDIECKYPNYRDRIRSTSVTSYDGSIEYVVVRAPSRTGKSTAFMAQYPDHYLLRNNMTHPFDDYRGQEVLIVDEAARCKALDWLSFHTPSKRMLPARYVNKTSCIKKVIFLSSVDLFQWTNTSQMQDFWNRCTDIWDYCEGRLVSRTSTLQVKTEILDFSVIFNSRGGVQGAQPPSPVSSV